MHRHLLALLVVLLLVAGGAGAAVAQAPARLAATGPTSVVGTQATAVFAVGDRTVRQVRYQDDGTLSYTFTLSNDGPLPLTVTGLAPVKPDPKLFRYLDLVDDDGATRFRVAAGGFTQVQLRLRMEACEVLSARAGSFAGTLNIHTTRAVFLDEVVEVPLPEELHTGSPREAFCPESTASSRPPG